jgi:hypothetical protein
MHKFVICNLFALSAVAGCAIDGPTAGDDKADTDEPTDPEATATTEQDLGPALPLINDDSQFGGNLVAEDFWYQIGGNCRPGFVRLEGPNDPGTQWSSSGGGYCGFAYWITPSNPADCRAMIHAHTNGWGFGGRCQSWIHEAEEGPRFFAYAAANTNNATSNTAPQQIVLGQGQTLTIGTTDVPGSSASGDTYLILYYPVKYPYFGQFANANDDAHPPARGSLMTFTAPTSGTYVISAGCYSNTSCSGTVAWTIQ